VWSYVEIAAVGKTYRRDGHETRHSSTSILRSTPANSSRSSGPSGCGKSTLLRLVAGLHLPTTGEVPRGWSRPSDRPQTNLGIVFQSPVLLDWRTALSNVLVQVELRGLQNRAITASARRSSSRKSGSRSSRTAIRTSCRAACASAWRSHAH
jgi:NitT/TauT family transport system ATP-binding protein